MSILQYKFNGEQDDCLMLLNKDGLTDLHDIAVLYETGIGMTALLDNEYYIDSGEIEEDRFYNLANILRELIEETERLTKRRR